VTLVFDHTTLGQRVLFGTGSAVDNALVALSDLAASRVLIVAGGSWGHVADAVAEGVGVVGRIEDVVPHVPAENARRAVAAAIACSADAVLTIGGGSATGLGKIVARETRLPVVAVPTTFAGSEATNVWGTTEAGRKTTGVDEKVLPRAIVYDAALLASMPARLAVSSGMNAIAHAIDGLWAPRADPVNRAMGTEGLRALVAGLRAMVAQPDSVEAREQALYGAYLAAVAFASAGSGLHHKICHALGGMYDLPHAETHSVVIGYVTAFNAGDAPDAAQRVTAALGATGSAGTALQALRRELGTPASLQQLGLREGDIEPAVDVILPSIPEGNPRPVTRHDLRGLLRAAWSGEEVD